jgi:hypothetical protein
MFLPPTYTNRGDMNTRTNASIRNSMNPDTHIHNIVILQDIKIEEMESIGIEIMLPKQKNKPIIVSRCTCYRPPSHNCFRKMDLQWLNESERKEHASQIYWRLQVPESQSSCAAIYMFVILCGTCICIYHSECSEQNHHSNVVQFPSAVTEDYFKLYKEKNRSYFYTS